MQNKIFENIYYFTNEYPYNNNVSKRGHGSSSKLNKHEYYKVLHCYSNFNLT